MDNQEISNNPKELPVNYWTKYLTPEKLPNGKTIYDFDISGALSDKKILKVVIDSYFESNDIQGAFECMEDFLKRNNLVKMKHG